MEFSKTYQYRKVMKPLLERKRRARINKCLDDLKDLMVECLTQDGEHVVRLEKADILELTVDYLKKMKSKNKADEQPIAESFSTGFKYAVKEVSKVLASTPEVNVQFGTMLMTNLGYRLNQLLCGFECPSQEVRDLSRSAMSCCSGSPVTVRMCEKDYSLPPSPASSGYESDASSEASNSSTSVWRPW